MFTARVRRRYAMVAVLGLSLYLVTAGGCGAPERSPEDNYATVPVFERTVPLTAGGDTLAPIRLQFYQDTLYVCYKGESRIDLFTPDLIKVRSFLLHDPEPVFPTAFVVTDSAVIVSDHARRLVTIYGRDEQFVEAFGLLPDKVTQLSPLAITFYGGVLYLTDIALRQVLVISLADAAGITETGELILTIPRDSSQSIGFPSAVCVTPDGRLLVGDAGQGLVRAFTCDGRPIYQFDTVNAVGKMAPQGMAFDDVLDFTLQDSSSFDPSGIRQMGRIHVVDGNNAAVHMFSPLGRYVASYSTEGDLQRPSAIAIDRARNTVYIADPAARRIVIYRYRAESDG